MSKYQGHTPGPWRSLSSGQFKGSDGKSLMRVLDYNARPLPRALIRWKDEPTMRLALDAPALLAENERLRAALEEIAARGPVAG